MTGPDPVLGSWDPGCGTQEPRGSPSHALLNPCFLYYLRSSDCRTYRQGKRSWDFLSELVLELLYLFKDLFDSGDSPSLRGAEGVLGHPYAAVDVLLNLLHFRAEVGMYRLRVLDHPTLNLPNAVVDFGMCYLDYLVHRDAHVLDVLVNAHHPLLWFRVNDPPHLLRTRNDVPDVSAHHVVWPAKFLEKVGMRLSDHSP